MIEEEFEREIDAPVDEVWAWVKDLENMLSILPRVEIVEMKNEKEAVVRGIVFPGPFDLPAEVTTAVVRDVVVDDSRMYSRTLTEGVVFELVTIVECEGLSGNRTRVVIRLEGEFLGFPGKLLGKFLLLLPVSLVGQVGGVLDEMGDTIEGYMREKWKKKLEKRTSELAEMEAELRAVLEGAVDSIYMVDEEGGYVLVNEEHLSRLGRGREEVIGSRFEDFHSESKAEDFLENVRKVFRTGEPVRQEHKWEDKDRAFLRTFSPVKDYETDEVVNVTVTSKEITERVKVQEREEFLHSLLRHDLGNKLQIIRNSFELMQDYNPGKEIEELMDMGLMASERGFDLIDKVQTLRQVSEEEKEPTEVGMIIDNVVNELKPRAIEKEIEIDKKRIECRVIGGTLLKELFSNLLENSIKHSGGEKIRISAQKTKDECIITIEDDGRGIPDEDKKEIFKRDYKRGPESGSGLGMYLVKRIAESYGGYVFVKDSDLGGARFDVTLVAA